MEHRSGGVRASFAPVFQGKAAGKRCKISLVRCWAAQAKTLKKRPQAEPLSHFRHEICL
ncbi:hypothetical protein [Campylobacter sp.]|uniref:hypothetical protein n=1 Tax=Campylobacter sp. TaxID=205 RepID=UPI002AA800D7|nr:hypothetical protein [Campylobacter sp.]MCI7447907.1 hypothetical protein [Campylobacter sp.]